jgi:Putative beta-barrel porin-2, OmpL-like. bbp2
MNIERGLLWAQEPLVTRGGQLGYTQDPLAFALQWTDGFYSNRYTWLTGSATYTLDPANSFVLAAGGNFSHTAKVTTTTPFFQTTATPLFQNNETLFSLAYTYNSAPWTITPYFQFTHVPASSSPPINTFSPGSTIGGAILANYTFGDESFLPGFSLLSLRVHRLDRQPSRWGAQSALRSRQQGVVDNLYANLSIQDLLCPGWLRANPS